jgi:hypothetical protein
MISQLLNLPARINLRKLEQPLTSYGNSFAGIISVKAQLESHYIKAVMPDRIADHDTRVEASAARVGSVALSSGRF